MILAGAAKKNIIPTLFCLDNMVSTAVTTDHSNEGEIDGIDNRGPPRPHPSEGVG